MVCCKIHLGGSCAYDDDYRDMVEPAKRTIGCVTEFSFGFDLAAVG